MYLLGSVIVDRGDVRLTIIDLIRCAVWLAGSSGLLRAGLSREHPTLLSGPVSWSPVDGRGQKFVVKRCKTMRNPVSSPSRTRMLEKVSKDGRGAGWYGMAGWGIRR